MEWILVFGWIRGWGICPRASLPHLFAISNQKFSKVGELWHNSSERWDRYLSWRRGLFGWEMDLVDELLRLLEGFGTSWTLMCGGGNLRRREFSR